MSVREERIQRRRDIIQKRCESSTRKDFDQEHNEHEIAAGNHDLLHTERQITESLSQLQRCIENQSKGVTSVRIQAEKEESLFQTKSEKSRNHILKQVEDNDSNDKEFDGDFVEAVWGETQEVLFKSNVKEMHETLEMARFKCEAMLQKKDDIFDLIGDGLRGQDVVFLETVKDQESTADSLRALMDSQMTSTRDLCRDELISIEEAVEKDRRNLMEKQSSDISASVEKKKQVESDSLNSMQKRTDAKIENAAKIHDEVTEDYNVLKNKLQDQVSQLERDWSVSRVLYTVSSDQIEYDHREVETKNAENEIRIKKSKKRIVQVKEDLKQELEHARLSEEKDKRKNGGLQGDCQRLEGQFQNLLMKLNRFDLLQEQTFSAASAMHKEEDETLSQKIRATQQAIHEAFNER